MRCSAWHEAPQPAVQLSGFRISLRSQLLTMSFGAVAGPGFQSRCTRDIHFFLCPAIDGQILSTAALSFSNGNPSNTKIVRLNAVGSVDARFNFRMQLEGQATCHDEDTDQI